MIVVVMFSILYSARINGLSRPFVTKHTEPQMITHEQRDEKSGLASFVSNGRIFSMKGGYMFFFPLYSRGC